MGSKYPKIPLIELVSIHDTKRKPITKSKRTSGIYPYYGASGITDYIDGYVFDGLYVLLAEDGDNLRTRNTPIAFTASGKFWVNNHAHVLKGQDDLDTQYICYALQHAEVDSYISGSTRPKITQGDLKKIPISAPPIKIRHQIAKLISGFDNKIELNRQTNQTLEKMAQALFKSWFVDFDPVIDNALAAGTNISDFPEPLRIKAEKRAKLRKTVQQSTDVKKLPEDIRKLFPSEFEESELGWMPKGWKISSFASLIKLIGGGTPKTTMEEYWNGDIPWFSVVDAPNDSDMFVIDTDKHITQLGVDKSSTRILRVGTTIISARGTVGKCALVAAPMAMNQSCYGVVGKNNISDEYIYFQTRHQVSDLQRRSHGSIFSTITRDTFKSILIAFSGDEITKKFKEVTKSSFDKILLNNKQNTVLGKLRDVLLPKLIAGKLTL